MAGELAAALVKAQASMPAVDKTAKANYGMYATLDHLIAKTRPVLNDNGLAIVQFPAVSDLGQPTLRTILVHSSGEQLSADMPLFVPRQDMQNLGSAITYAKRYAWSAVLGIAADDDDDGTVASPDNQPAAKAQQRSTGTTQAPKSSPLPQNGSAAEFRFTSGKHEGKTLAEAPADYLDWYAANGPKQDVRELIAVYQGVNEAVALNAQGSMSAAPDDDIPFMPSIDGIS